MPSFASNDAWECLTSCIRIVLTPASSEYCLFLFCRLVSRIQREPPHILSLALNPGICWQRFLCSFHISKYTYAFLFLFTKSHSLAGLFGCKRPYDGSFSLPIFWRAARVHVFFTSYSIEKTIKKPCFSRLLYITYMMIIYVSYRVRFF